MTLSEAREEKNFEDRLADYQAKKEAKRKLEKIQYLEAKIKQSKLDIVDCLKLNMFSFAKNKIERIQEMQNLINKYKS